MAGELALIDHQDGISEALSVSSDPVAGGFMGGVPDGGTVVAAPLHDLFRMNGAWAGVIDLPSGYNPLMGMPDGWSVGPVSRAGFNFIFDAAGALRGVTAGFSEDDFTIGVLPVNQMEATVQEMTAGLIGQPTAAFNSANGGMDTMAMAGVTTPWLNWTATNVWGYQNPGGPDGSGASDF